MLKQPKSKDAKQPKSSNSANVTQSQTNSKPVLVEKSKRATVDDMLEFISLINPIMAKRVRADVDSGKLNTKFVNYFASFDKLYLLTFMLFSEQLHMRSFIIRDMQWNVAFFYINEHHIMHYQETPNRDYTILWDDPHDRIMFCKDYGKYKTSYCPELLNKDEAKLAKAFNTLSNAHFMYHDLWISGYTMNSYIKSKNLDPKYLYIHPDNDKKFEKLYDYDRLTVFPVVEFR